MVLVGRRTLQACVAIGALVPILAGGWGALAGLSGGDAELLSHQRYLSGLLLAIGLAFWSTVPDIQDKTGRFRLLTLLVVIGGLCRLLGVVLGDGLSWPIAAALVMELAVTPLLCLWQARLDGPGADCG